MNNKCVSAVIGVILMVAIVVAIAGTVFLYVSSMIHDESSKEYISGYLTDIYHVTESKFCVTLDNDSYFVSFDKDKDEYYSFTVGNYYWFRIYLDTWTNEYCVTLVIEREV